MPETLGFRNYSNLPRYRFWQFVLLKLFLWDVFATRLTWKAPNQCHYLYSQGSQLRIVRIYLGFPNIYATCTPSAWSHLNLLEISSHKNRGTLTVLVLRFWESLQKTESRHAIAGWKLGNETRQNNHIQFTCNLYDKYITSYNVTACATLSQQEGAAKDSLEMLQLRKEL